jgi:hypothetical protein
MPEPILHEPAAIFMTLMAVILIAPLLTKQVNLPGIVGLILGGMLLGGHGLNLLVVGKTMELFGAVGLIYLMLQPILCHFSCLIHPMTGTGTSLPIPLRRHRMIFLWLA